MLRIVTLVSAIAFLPVFGKECVRVISNGESCETLRVDFDFSACGKSGHVLHGKVNCQHKPPTAVAKTEAATYSVELKQGDSWADRDWKSGPVKERPVRKLAGNQSQAAQPWEAPKEETAPAKTEAVVSTPPSPAESILPVTPVTPAATSVAEKAGTDGIQISGNFDGYYSYNFNNPAVIAVPTTNTLPAGNTQMRYYDAYANQFTVNLAEITLKKTKGELGFLLDLDFGLQADMNSTDEVGKHIGQAIVTYNPSWAPGLVIEFGKMATHLGYELIKSKDNWQYSRSTTFGFGSPFWNTGIHLGYAVSPVLAVNGYIYNNSVNNGFYATSMQKALGAQVKFTPTTNFAIAYNFITGGDMSGFQNKKTIHETNITYTYSPKMSFALELLTGQDLPAAGPSFWKGVTAHLKYRPLESYSFSPRLEIFDDSNGYATAAAEGHTLYGVTLTNAFYLAPDLEARLELRADQSSKGVFRRGDGSTSYNQVTTTFAILYGF